MAAWISVSAGMSEHVQTTAIIFMATRNPRERKLLKDRGERDVERGGRERARELKREEGWLLKDREVLDEKGESES